MDIRQVVIWINGLRNPKTVNECNQALYSFSQDFKNIGVLITIIRHYISQRSGFSQYLTVASLHILRSMIINCKEPISNILVLDLFNYLLQIYSKIASLRMIKIFKSIFVSLFNLSECSFCKPIIAFYHKFSETNSLATILLIHILCNFGGGEDDEDSLSQNLELLVSFTGFTYGLIGKLLRLKDFNVKAYFLHIALDVLKYAFVQLGEKPNLEILPNFSALFQCSEITFKYYYSLWISLVNILIQFDLFYPFQEMIIELIKYSSTIADPFYYYSSLMAFIPHIQSKIFPIGFIEILIQHELIVLSRLSVDDNSPLFYQADVLDEALLAYTSTDEEKAELYNYVKSLIFSNSNYSEISLIFYYSRLVTSCFSIAKENCEEIINFFDNFFKPDSPVEIMISCLNAIPNLFNISYYEFSRMFFVHFYHRFLFCLLSDVFEIRKSARKLFQSDSNVIECIDPNIVGFLFENRDSLLQKDPYSFLAILLICLNKELPIPDSYIENVFRDVMIPLLPDDMNLLELFASILAFNEFWVEPMLAAIEPIFTSKIDEYIEIVTNGSNYFSPELNSIVLFLSRMLLYYHEFFYRLAQPYICKLLPLLRMIGSVNNEFFYCLAKNYSIALKYFNDPNFSEELSKTLFQYILDNSYEDCYKNAYFVFAYSIRFCSIETANLIVQRSMEILNRGIPGLYFPAYFRVFSGIFKNPGMTPEISASISAFFMEYFNKFVASSRFLDGFFYSLGKIFNLFPDFHEWTNFLLAKLNELPKNCNLAAEIFNLIYRIVTYEFLDTNEFNESIVNYSIQVYLDPESVSSVKSKAILVLSKMMDGRSQIAIDFVVKNFQNFAQIALDSNNLFFLEASNVILCAASLNIDNLDVNVINRCVQNFPNLMSFFPNIFALKQFLLLCNNNQYKNAVELSILNSLFNFLIKPLQKILMVKKALGPFYDNLKAVFVALANKYGQFVQNKIAELQEYPSRIRRIQLILDPPSCQPPQG